MATEKKQKSILYDENSIHKIEMVTKNVGMVYSGMGPDFRFVLVVILEVLLAQISFIIGLSTFFPEFIYV